MAKFLRTTVPMTLAKQMDLAEGDYLEWELDKTGNGWFATVKKA